MLVIVIRHGEASEPSGEPDGVRHLTRQGREQTAAVVRALVARGIVPSHIYTSPLVRAVQTAEIVASVINHPGPIVALESLVPGARRAISTLAQRAPSDRVALVTHEPTAHSLAGQLIGVPSFPAFRTSGIAVIDLDDAGEGTLVGRLDPSAMRWRGPGDLGP